MLALDRPLWRLLAGSGAIVCAEIGASRTVMIWMGIWQRFPRCSGAAVTFSDSNISDGAASSLIPRVPKTKKLE